MTDPILKPDPNFERNIPGGLFFAALTVVALGASALSAYESYALLTPDKPITQRTRDAWHKYPTFVAPLIFGAGALLAHFFWGPVDHRKDDEAQ